MASLDLGTLWLFSSIESFDGSLNIHIEEVNSAYSLDSLYNSKSTVHCSLNIPKPPPLPAKIWQRTNNQRRLENSCSIPRETKDIWDRLFKEGYAADVHIITENESIPAHYSVLCVASPVLGNFLQQSKPRNGIRYIKIPGLPNDDIYVFIHLLEQRWLTTENVIDVLQLAKNCDAPRLSLTCVLMIVKEFKTISSTEGWKVMKRDNPGLEQKLLESVVEA